jgi:DNA-binding IclR family transcriptional regulator
VLHDLHLRTAAVTHLGVLDGPDVVHVDKLGGPSAERVPTRVGTRVVAHRVALGVAALASVPPEDVGMELAAELDRVRRVGGLVRRDDYGAGLTSVAATVGTRAAMGIVLPGNVSGDRYLPLVIDAAIRIHRSL